MFMKVRIIVLLLTVVFLVSCKPDEPGFDPSSLKITSFKIINTTPQYTGNIDHDTREIKVEVPFGTDITELIPAIEHTPGATLTPDDSVEYDFTAPVNFYLSVNTDSVQYTASVEISPSDENQLLEVKLPDLYFERKIDDSVNYFELPYGTDRTSVKINFKVSANATITPASGSSVDLTGPLNVNVTAANGDEKEYLLTFNQAAQDTAVRAFWIPAPWHSPILRSYNNIVEGVEMAKDLNFNTLFVGAWAQGKSLYESTTLLENSWYTTFQQSVFWNYQGGTGDPLYDIIDVAHDNGLKVILWYEYGFMAKYGDVPTESNDPLLAEHPDWIGINNNGEPCNYNGTDFYYNAYHPEVQQFMIDFMMEAVSQYNIDGVQGDDRMPAIPRNSGYDDYTISKYKAEHDGNTPPNDYNDEAWVDWRANILNQFWQRLYDTVKMVKPNCLVTCSPNAYPWAFENLMQEWPVWVENNTVEILSVQSYRKTLASYRYVINEALGFYSSHGDGNLQRFVPGVLLYGSDGLVKPETLASQIAYNREVGIKGESFFYDEPLKKNEIKKVIKAFYPGEAIFPDFTN